MLSHGPTIPGANRVVGAAIVVPDDENALRVCPFGLSSDQFVGHIGRSDGFEPNHSVLFHHCNE
jgi:hypothetical protein